MSKKRSHKPAVPRGDKNVITITADQQRKMREAAMRQTRLAAPKQTGSGNHGGGFKAETRRERHQTNRDLRRVSLD